MLLWQRKEIQAMSLSQLTKDWVSSRLPKRPKSANKGTFGKVLVVAGSEKYPGAAYLCCAAAYRVGAGLVTLLTTPEVKVIVSRKLPEVTFTSKPSIDYDVLLFGPGLGKNTSAAKFINILPKAVIDGDGFKFFKSRLKKAVLTPHPGEMSRMTGLSIKQIQENREEVAKEFAKKWGQVVVLKGANTVIASPIGGVRLSPFANPALATAGTGDVLAGIIAGFLAQGLSSFNAACCGVYIHGMAGEIIKEEIGDAGMIASDLLPKLPLTIKKLTQHIQTLDQ